MKRSIFFVLAAIAGLLVALLALDVINFETDQSDGRAVIVGIGCVVLLAALGFSGAQQDETDTGRTAAARRLGEGRVDPADLPSKPGSLLRQAASPTEVLAVNELTADEPVATVEFDEPELDEPAATIAGNIEDVAVAVVAVTEPAIDPVDAELQSLIDDDQMYEINQLVEAADEPDDHEDHSEIVQGSESVEPLARLELHLADYDDEDLKRVVKESESVVVAEMVRTGQLTSEGELTEKDIASMVFLAYTSEEMLTELRLRKSLNHQTLDPRSLDQQVLDQPRRDQ